MDTSHSYMEYPSTKWTTDPALRRCSLSARGLFAHVLVLVHGEPASGSPISAAVLQDECGISPCEFRRLAAELEREGLISQDGESIHVRRDWLA